MDPKFDARLDLLTRPYGETGNLEVFVAVRENQRLASDTSSPLYFAFPVKNVTMLSSMLCSAPSPLGWGPFAPVADGRQLIQSKSDKHALNPSRKYVG